MIPIFNIEKIRNKVQGKLSLDYYTVKTPGPIPFSLIQKLDASSQNQIDEDFRS